MSIAPFQEQPPGLGPLLLATGKFCAGVIGSMLILLLLWSTPSTRQSTLQMADNDAPIITTVR